MVVGVVAAIVVVVLDVVVPVVVALPIAVIIVVLAVFEPLLPWAVLVPEWIAVGAAVPMLADEAQP